VEAVTVDYTGFVVEDRFLVGYGLDLDEQWRNLPFVGVLESAPR
jgi:hypoxanthine phosphoribosyltransferase